MTAQVFQYAACAWRCWYCFVPNNLLNADPNHAKWFSTSELVELYSQVSNPPRIIVLSGGSPDLIPEWTLWMMTALKEADIDHNTYLWADDNLSTTYFLDKLSASDHEMMRNYPNYGRVCCIKGFDETSFAFNTRAEPEGYYKQFEILRSVLDLGLDTYGYVTLTSPHADHVTKKVANLIDRLQEINTDLPLRFVPLRIEVFAPVKQRLACDPARENSLGVQEEAIAVWNSEIKRRFNVRSRAKLICDVKLNSYQ